ncbi:hypothetical protein V496_08166, partial [Pseudogymnoascus sp. VKM F-4515 (FW-2607)]
EAPPPQARLGRRRFRGRVLDEPPRWELNGPAPLVPVLREQQPQADYWGSAAAQLLGALVPDAGAADDEWEV